MSKGSFVISTAAVCLAAAGCNCGHPTLLSDRGIPKVATRVDFGNVQVGQSVSRSLMLANVGGGPLQIASQLIAGAPFKQTTVFNGLIVAGDTSAGVVAFAPTAAGPATGTLTLTDDGNPASVVVTLVGNGVNLALTVQPGSLDFGKVPVGIHPAPHQTVTFTNGNNLPVYLTLNTSSTAREYTLTDASGAPVAATPVVLQPNAPYAVTVTFAPDSVSIFNSAFVYTSCADAASQTCLPPQTFPLSGQGVQGSIALSPNPIVFSGVQLGSTAQQTITVANVGGADATVSCLSFQSLGGTACGAPTPLFSLSTPSLVMPAALAPGKSFTVTLTYTASGPGNDVLVADYTADGLPGSATATDAIHASQTSTPCQLKLSPTALGFSPVSVGVPLTKSVTVSNIGGETCTVTGIALDPSSDPSYALASGQAQSFSLAPAASAQMAVTFTLNNSGAPFIRRGAIDFQSTDPALTHGQVPMSASQQLNYAGGGAWPRWHHDNLQSGLSPVDTSGLKGTVAWTAHVGAPGPSVLALPTNDYLNSPVVGEDGTVFQQGFGGTLYAFNPDGSTQWATFMAGTLADPHPSTPIIVSDGSLFVAFGETYMLQKSDVLYHVSSSGVILASLPPPVVAGATADGFDLPPILTNGGLLLGGDDFAGGFAYAPTTSGGFQLVANAPPSAGPIGSAATSGDQMSAVVGPDDTSYWCGGSLCYALTPPTAGFAPSSAWPQGGITASSYNSLTSDLAFDASVTGNLIVLFGGWAVTVTGSQELAAVSPSNGAVIWSRLLPAPTLAQQEPEFDGMADATAGNSCPAIAADGTVYVGNFDGLHAVDGATGQEKAGFPFSTHSVVLTAPAIGADGTVFFGTADGSFYGVHPDGTQRFLVTAGGRIAGSPAIGPSGAVYFVADDGNLYAVN